MEELDKKKVSIIAAAAVVLMLLVVLIVLGVKGCSNDKPEEIKKTERVEPARKYEADYKTMQVTVYAYCPCAICNTKKWKGMVSTGRKMKDILAEGKNIAAADPDVLPLGTTFTYEGKEYTVADTGKDIKGNTINILKNTHAEAYAFGVKRNQTIRINR